MGVIQRQGIKNILSSYLGILLGLVNLLFLQPRLLTAEELGLTRILFSFSMLISMFASLGIGSMAVKFLPLSKDKETKHHGFFGLLLLFPILGIVLVTFLLYYFKTFFSEQYASKASLFVEFYDYVLPMVASFAILNAIQGYCYALIKTTVPLALNEVYTRIMIMVAVCLYYLKLFSLSVFISSFACIYFLQALILVVYILYEEPISLRIDWVFFKKEIFGKMIAFSLILWIGEIASVGIKEFGTILLGKFVELQYVAFYVIASFIPSVIEAPIRSMDKIIAPNIVGLWDAKKHDEIRVVFQKGSLYMLLLGGFLFINININLEGIFAFLPHGYDQGKWVVVIVSIGTLINMASGPNGTILNYSEKYVLGFVWVVINSALLFVLQLILLPLMGIVGAAIATCISAICYNTGISFFIWKNFNIQPYGRKNIIVLILIVSITVFGFFIPHVSNPIIDITIRSSLVSILFIGLVYFLKIIPEFHRYIPFLTSTKSRD